MGMLGNGMVKRGLYTGEERERASHWDSQYRRRIELEDFARANLEDGCSYESPLSLLESHTRCMSSCNARKGSIFVRKLYVETLITCSLIMYTTSSWAHALCYCPYKRCMTMIMNS